MTHSMHNYIILIKRMSHLRYRTAHRLMANIKQARQALARMRRKGDSRALLVGMQAGAAPVEKSTERPQKGKNGATLRPGNCTSGYLWEENENSALKTYLNPPAHCSIIYSGTTWKQPKCPPTHERTKEMWSPRTMGYNSPLKRTSRHWRQRGWTLRPLCRGR